MIDVLIFAAATVAVIFLVRLFGAWMLRIDEVITNQKLLIDSIDRLNNNMGNVFESQQSETDLTRQDLLLKLENKLKKGEITETEYEQLRKQITEL